jgi:hypothetical protein
VLNPIGTVPLFITITQNLKKEVSKTAIITSGIVLVVFAIAGTGILRLFGITIYSMDVANAQSTNTTKNMTGSNMSKTMNMTAGGGNMTKSTHHHRTTEITRAPGL